MALVQLLLGKNVRKGFVRPEDSGNTDEIALELDATMLEAPDYAATPTRSEVESGTNITDHVTLSPETLTIEGIMTNTPIGIQQLLSSQQFRNQNDNRKKSRSQDAFLFLKKLYDDRLPFDFVGGLKVYTSMVITSFSPSRTSTTGQALRFRMTMQKIRIVESEIIEQKRFSKDTGYTAQKKQELGRQATSTASANASERASSIIIKFFPNILR